MSEATPVATAPATMPSNLSVIGVFDTMGQAEEAIRRLGEAGFPLEHVSILGRDLQSETRVNGFVTTKDMAKEGATIGAWVGGLFGLLTGVAALFVPGVGPIFVLGPLAATVIGAAEGAVWTGAFGAILGHFVEKRRIPKYEEHLRAGKYLVVVHGSEDEVRRAQQILTEQGATDVERHDAAA